LLFAIASAIRLLSLNKRGQTCQTVLLARTQLLNGQTQRENKCLRATKKPEVTLLDQLLAGQLNLQQASQCVLDAAYHGLQQFCDIPAGYRHCELGTASIPIDALPLEALEELLAKPPAKIVNPHKPHREFIELCHLFFEGDPLVCKAGDPFQPMVGASLFGPPGTGKTHLMAAFAKILKLRLDQKLEEYRRKIAAFIAGEYAKFKEDYGRSFVTGVEGVRQYTVTMEDAGEGEQKSPNITLEERKDPATRFADQLQKFMEALRQLSHQPTDVLYLGFTQLCDLYADGRKVAIQALESARLVFVDDVNPEHDPARAELVHRLIERRYEIGRPGTFITTNLTTEQLGGGDPAAAKRLLSRVGATLMEINFDGCIDWRLEVQSRRKKLIAEKIAKRLKTRETPS